MIELVSFTDKQHLADQFVSTIKNLRENGFVIFLNILEEIAHQNFYLKYVLYHPELLNTETVKLIVPNGFIVPSLQEFWVSARADERSIWERHEISFRPYFRTSLYFSDLWVNEQTVLLDEINSRERECQVFKRDEWVPDLKVGARIRNHRVIDGHLFPKINKHEHENNSFFQYLGQLEKMHPLYSEFWGQSWLRILEEKSRVVLSERAMAVRMLLMELNRSMGHWKLLSDLWKSMGENQLFESSIHWFERMNYLWESYCGKGRSLSPLCFGGLRFNLTSSWISLCIDWVEEMQKGRFLIEKNFHAKKYLVNKLSSAKVQPDMALAYGFGGVNLRASGFNYDERKTSPYYFYDQLDFSIPVGDGGETYDRIVLRLEEIYQSSRLMIQLLDNLPLGDVTHEDWTLEKVVTEGIPEILSDVSTVAEAPHGFIHWYFHHGEWVKGTPSFRSHQIWPELSRNLSIEQSKSCLISLGFSYGELQL